MSVYDLAAAPGKWYPSLNPPVIATGAPLRKDPSVVDPYATPVIDPYATPVIDPYATPVIDPYATPVIDPNAQPVHVMQPMQMAPVGMQPMGMVQPMQPTGGVMQPMQMQPMIGSETPYFDPYAGSSGQMVGSPQQETSMVQDFSSLPKAMEGARLVLVKKDSPNACKLADSSLSLIRQGSTAPMVLQNGDCIGPFWPAPRTAWNHWNYIDIGVGKVQPFQVSFEAPYIVWRSTEHGEFVFDVSMWKLKEGNHLVVVKACAGEPGGPTRMSKDACGRDFMLNADGTFSMRTQQHLVLGYRPIGSEYADWTSPYARIDAKDLDGQWCCVSPLGLGCSHQKAVTPDAVEDFGCCVWMGPAFLCVGGELRTRIPNTNSFRHFKDPNNVTYFGSSSRGCNGIAMICKIGPGDGKAWRKIGTEEIAANNWKCCCWCIPCGMASFAKLKETDDTLTQKGICCFNGICTPFEEKRHRMYVQGVPSNGFYKADDPGNIDWYWGPDFVGNGGSCSMKC